MKKLKKFMQSIFNFLPYWRNESSGFLAAAVEKYLLTTDELTPSEVELIKTYLQLWSDYPWQCIDEEGVLKLKEKCDLIANRSTINSWVDYALDNAINPF